MSSWTPPVDELKFLLHRVVGIGDLLSARDLDATDVDAVLDEAGRFASGVLAPLNRSGDRHPAVLENGVVRTAPGWIDAYRQYAEGGWTGLAADPEHGGQGLPLAVSSAVTEMWNSANMAFALCPLLTQAAIEVLEAFGTEAQKALWLAPLVEGRWTGTMNLTEPQAGSDLSQVRARAVPAGDGTYRVSGQKIYITYGDHDLAPNIVHLVLARLPDGPPGIKGISLFLVPKIRVEGDGSLGARNAVRALGLEHKMGIHASPTCTMAYGDDDAADGGAWAELIGEPHRGIEYMFRMMNNARLAVGAQGVGIAESAYAHASAYARARIQGRPPGDPVPGQSTQGRPILGHPDVRRMLATARARIVAARALVLETAALLDRGRAGDRAAQARGDLLIPVVKAWSTDLGVDVASTGIQIHGGMGFIEESGAAQFYRDARIAPIYEGTNGIQAADLVGRKVQRDGGATLRLLIADIRAATAALGDVAGSEAAALAGAMAEATDALARAGDHLIAIGSGDPAASGAATPFLDLMGMVTGGWMMARAMTAAQQSLAADDGDPAFSAHLTRLAAVYAAYVLPFASATERVVTGGGASLLAVDENRL